MAYRGKVLNILDHLHRTCCTRNVPRNLQAEVCLKLGACRRCLASGSEELESIGKALTECGLLIGQLCRTISGQVNQQLCNIHGGLLKAARKSQGDDAVMSLSLIPKHGSHAAFLLKKRVKEVRDNMKRLQHLTKIKVVVRKCANRIRSGKGYSKKELLAMMKSYNKNHTELYTIEESLKMVITAENAKVPNSLKADLNDCLTRARKTLMGESAAFILNRPLEELKKALARQDRIQIRTAIEQINDTITHYNTLQMILNAT